MNKIYYYLLIFPLLSWSQTNKEMNVVVRHYYKDKVVSVENWKGTDNITDSLKTYYSNGQLKEVFYFDDKGYRNLKGYQFNSHGEKLVTWEFLHGKLLSRTDHKLPYNKVSEEIVKNTLKSLTELNTRTNYNPTKIGDLYKRGSLRYRLGNTTLALDDLKKVERFIIKKDQDKTKTISDSTRAKNTKFESVFYDLLANIYVGMEMENYAYQYFHKATTLAPKDNRIAYNFANFLQIKKENELARYYLEKILVETPNHAHARWAIAKLYSDSGEYEKAMYNINLAFEREDAIIKGSLGASGRDLRTTRGLLYHKLGESEKGIQDLKDALEINKDNAYAMKNLGIIYLDQKKYNEACALFQKAKELNYTLTYDENDLDALLESACNNVQPEIVVKNPKPFVFPNPVASVLTIKNYDYKTFDYEFFDFESNSALRGTSSNGTIDASQLKAGFYILKVFNTDSPQTFKIIKE